MQPFVSLDFNAFRSNSSNDAAAVLAPGREPPPTLSSSSCVLRCPQCQHLINLLASIVGHHATAPAGMAGSPNSQKDGFGQTPPSGPRLLPSGRDDSAGPLSGKSVRRKSQQNVRLSTGHTVRLVSNATVVGQRVSGKPKMPPERKSSPHPATAMVVATETLLGSMNAPGGMNAGAPRISISLHDHVGGGSAEGMNPPNVPLRHLTAMDAVTSDDSADAALLGALEEFHCLGTATSHMLPAAMTSPQPPPAPPTTTISSPPTGATNPLARPSSWMQHSSLSRMSEDMFTITTNKSRRASMNVMKMSTTTMTQRGPGGDSGSALHTLRSSRLSTVDAAAAKPSGESDILSRKNRLSFGGSRRSGDGTCDDLSDEDGNDSTSGVSPSAANPSHVTHGALTWAKWWNALKRRPALDDAQSLLQLIDICFVLCSVYLCCYALFLINASTRPWLINVVTVTLTVVAQLVTLAWTILRCFVRNRDAVTSFVVNDTVGVSAKKYLMSVVFWLDVIVAMPMEWMIIALLERDLSWWEPKPTAVPVVPNASISTTTSSTSSNDFKLLRTQWETTAAVFSFLMLRHFLRYWRIASLIRSSNPIVSERSIFKFLFAVSIALGVVCTCAVAFQAWEGPTLAPLLAAAATAGIGNRNDTLMISRLALGAGAVTTSTIFASFDALYWSMTTALTVGYGDITPRTPGGRAIAMLTMILGSALLSTMTAIATSYFANKDPVQQELEQRKRKMTSMLEFFEVPWELQRDVIASFPAMMEVHNREAFLDMIEHLPEICRNRVEGYSRLRLLRRIHLFEGIERDHAFLLAKCLTQRFVAAQDTVVVQGELGNEMYFVVQGMLDVVVRASVMESDEHIVVATLKEGSFFGERGLLEDMPRRATVVAITLTELLVLTRADFQDIVRMIPGIMDIFRRNVFHGGGGDATAEDAAAAVPSTADWLIPVTAPSPREAALSVETEASRKVMTSSLLAPAAAAALSLEYDGSGFAPPPAVEVSFMGPDEDAAAAEQEPAAAMELDDGRRATTVGDEGSRFS